MTNSTIRFFAAAFFALSTVIAYAQQGSTPEDGNNPMASVSNTARIGDPAVPLDGSTVLGPTYLNTACGLNYTSASQKIGQRFSPAGVPQPATFAIAGIPATAVIEKAYVWCGSSGNGVAVNLTVTDPFALVNNYPMAVIGSDQDKCWGYSGTHTYRADITASITGNGNYTISGFPTSISSGGTNDVDGATMMVIWSDPTSTVEGTIVIWDGCVVINGGVTTQTINNFNACAQGVCTAKAFMAIADLQGLGANLTMNGGAPFTITEDWWNYVEQPTTVAAGQSSAAFDVNSSGDCYNLCLIGLYYQSLCPTCGPTGAFTTTTSQTPATCAAGNGSATVTVNGGSGPFTYVWNTVPVQNTPTATNLTPGQYIVTVTDGLPCPNIVIDTITVLGTGSLPFTTSQVDVLCNGGNNGSAVFTPSGVGGPYTYTWTPNVSSTNTAGTLTAGTYVVNVTDGFGCTASHTFVVTEPALIPISANPSPGVSICTGGITVVSVNPSGGAPPYSYNWLNGPGSNSSLTVTPSVTTTYSCVVSDACGNQADTGMVTVVVNPTPVISFTSDVQAGCAPLCVNFTPQSNPLIATCIWQFGDSDSSTAALSSHCYQTTGSYDVTLIVIDVNGCTNQITQFAYIVVHPDPVAGFGILTPQPTTLEESTIGFDNLSIGGDTCHWDFGDGNIVTDLTCADIVNVYDDTGAYHVMQIVVNQYGCADTAYSDVVIVPNTTLYVPNTFTPNGDGKNDIFFAYGEFVDDFHMMVFDRWGNLIFESRDIYKGWDGRVNGHPTIAQIDTYVWRITFSDKYTGNYHRLIGHVNLIR